MKNMKARVIPVLAALVISAMAMPGTSQAAELDAPAQAAACTTVIASSPIVRGDWVTGQGSYPISTVVIRMPVCVDKKTGRITGSSSPSWSFKNTAGIWNLNYPGALPGGPPNGSNGYSFTGQYFWRLVVDIPVVSIDNFVMYINGDLQTAVYNSSFVQACGRVRSIGMSNVRNPRASTPQWSCVLMPR